MKIITIIAVAAILGACTTGAAQTCKAKACTDFLRNGTPGESQGSGGGSSEAPGGETAGK